MARPLRIEFAGAIYHVTSRGDRREDIYENDADRQCFLDVVSQAMKRFDAVALAYCLMDNHYHFVIQTQRANLSSLMRQINGIYTQAYNRQHNKVGHLFQGRFKAILVDRDAYLLEVCRYVDLNPVRARLVRAPGNWRWSSYAAHTGTVAGPEWLDTKAVYGYLLGHTPVTSAQTAKAANRYAALVAAGKGVALWEQALSRQIYLGDQDFIDKMRAKLDPVKANSKEIPRAQRKASAKLLQHYLGQAANRDAGIVQALREGHYSLTEIAGAVGLSLSRVSRIVKQNGQ